MFYALKDFHYDLPEELIARYPLPNRTSSRLLCLDKDSGALAHRVFTELPTLLKPSDLLVFNNTRVIPARLFGHKATGGKVEILIERILDKHRALAQIKTSKKSKLGSQIFLEQDVLVEISAVQDEFVELHFLSDKTILEILENIGHIPLPPYMQREDENTDRERYQTVYAENPGAVAAPTAGLHFDEKLMKLLKEQNIEMAFVTLHVGAGTFKPVRVADIRLHKMHSEYIEISEQVCQKIQQAKAEGRRVIAVGTTALRTLESAAISGEIKAFTGDTSIFIYPGYTFRCVDAMITNFHLPESTLLMLICAFAGYNNAMNAYQVAVAEKYRFFSYGDAMWIA